MNRKVYGFWCWDKLSESFFLREKGMLSSWKNNLEDKIELWKWNLDFDLFFYIFKYTFPY